MFLSSHLMSEMAQTADQLLVIGRGKILTAGPVQEVIDSVSGTAVRVRSPQVAELERLLARPGVSATSPEAGTIDLRGTTAEAVGEAAAAHGIVLHELSQQRASLEEAYMSLTQDSVEYRSDVAHANSSPHTNPSSRPSQKEKN